MSDIAQLGLDVTEIVKSLQLVVAQWQNLKKALSSGALSVAVDTKSFGAIKTAIEQTKTAMASVGKEMIQQATEVQVEVGKVEEKTTAQLKKETAARERIRKAAAKEMKAALSVKVDSAGKEITWKTDLAGENQKDKFKALMAKRQALRDAGHQGEFETKLGNLGDITRMRADKFSGADKVAIQAIEAEHKKLNKSILDGNVARTKSIELMKTEAQWMAPLGQLAESEGRMWVEQRQDIDTVHAAFRRLDEQVSRLTVKEKALFDQRLAERGKNLHKLPIDIKDPTSLLKIEETVGADGGITQRKYLSKELIQLIQNELKATQDNAVAWNHYTAQLKRATEWVQKFEVEVAKLPKGKQKGLSIKPEDLVGPDGFDSTKALTLKQNAKARQLQNAAAVKDTKAYAAEIAKAELALVKMRKTYDQLDAARKKSVKFNDDPKALLGKDNKLDALFIAEWKVLMGDVLQLQAQSIALDKRKVQSTQEVAVVLEKMTDFSRRLTADGQKQAQAAMSAAGPMVGGDGKKDNLRIQQLWTELNTLNDSLKLNAKHWDDTKKRIRQADEAAQKYNETLAKLGPNAQRAANAANGPITGKSFLTASGDLDHDRVRKLTPGLVGLKNASVELGSETNKILQGHRAIGTELASSITRAVKFVVLYRVLHTVVNGVQSAMRQLIQSGLEYTQQQELQKLGLTGILAENFKLINAQGKELTGVSEIVAVQRESARQWRQIQSASLAVVGTTADMMLLYSSIVPYASRLSASLDDIQKMTKSTAVAASLMDISFQDARSAIVSLLQGRYLSRNRLVSSLGFTKEEVSSLAGTPALFVAINNKLEEFSLLSKDASNSLGALRETFNDVVGVVGQAFAKPLVAIFKKFMGGVGEGGIMGMLFENEGNELQPAKEILGLFQMIEVVMTDALKPLEAFGEEMRSQASTLPPVIVAIGKVVNVIIELALSITRASIAVTAFVARNKSLLDLGMALIKWGVIASVFFSVARSMTVLSENAGLLARVMNPIILGVQNLVQEFVVKFIPAMGGATGAVNLFRTSLITLSTGTVILAAAAGIFFLIQRYMHLRDVANDAAKAMKLARAGDVFGGLAELASETDPSQRARKGIDIVTQGLKVLDTQQSVLTDVNGNLISIGEGGRAVVGTINSIIVKLNELEARKKVLDESGKGKVGKERLGIENTKALVQAEIGAQNDLIDQAIDYMERRKTVLGIGLSQSRTDEAGIQGLINALPKRPTGALSLSAQNIAKNAESDRGLFGRQLAKQKAHTAGIQAETLALVANQRALNAVVSANATFKAERLEDPTPDTAEAFGATDMDSLRKSFTDDMATLEHGLENSFKRRLISEKDYNDERMKLAQIRLVTEAKFIDAEEAKYLSDVAIHNAKVTKNSSSFVNPDAVKSKVADFAAQRNALRNQGVILTSDILAQDAENERERAELLEGYSLDAGKRRATILGLAEEEITAKYKLEADKRVKAMRDKGGFTDSQVNEARDAIMALAPLEIHVKALDDRLAFARLTTDSLRQSQDLLEQSFQSGSVSVGSYVKRMEELRVAQIESLDAQRAVLEEKIKDRAFDEQGFERTDAGSVADVGAMRLQVLQLDMALGQLLDPMARVHAMFQAWSGLSSNLRGISQIFGSWGDELENVVNALDKAFATMQSMIEMKNSFMAFTGSVGTLGGMMGMTGGIFGKKKQAPGQYSTGFDDNGIATSAIDLAGETAQASGAVSDTMSKAGAALGMATMGASLAITVGVAIFNHAVAKQKEKITKAFKTISDTLAAGDITGGQALERMVSERARLQRDLSRSKTGRAALKELIPDIDAQIADFKNRAKQAAKEFGEELEKMFALDQAGGGPMGTFVQMLYDMQQKAKDALKDLAPNTAAYTKALGQIVEMWKLTLKAAKAKFEQEMQSYEQDAMSTAETILGLMDEEESLAEQMVKLDKEMQDIAKETAEIEKDRLDIEQKKLDLAEERRKIEEKIAEILRDAADAEADIRRQGLIEAQQTVAARKAADISKLRRDTSAQLLAANLELAALDKDTRVADAILKVAEREASLQEHLKELARNREKLVQSQQINAIRMSAAMEIYGIEGAIFTISLDRVDMETRRGQIDVAQARERVTKWQETKDLIAWITDHANQEGLLNPPPGFPQIRIQISSINIDNRDMSSNAYDYSSTTTVEETRNPRLDKQNEDDRQFPGMVP